MKLNNSLLVQELIKYSQFLRNKLIKNTSLKIDFIYVAVLLGLILINYFISIRIYGGQEFFVNWASARLLFMQGINPYSQEALKLLSDLAKELFILPSGGNFQFISPIYSLFIYLPFGLIKNFYLSRAIWITVMELTAFVSGYLILTIFNWRPEKLIKNVFFAFSLIFFFMILNLLNGSNLVFLNLLYILGLMMILDGKYVRAGILLALLTINIQTFFIPLITIFIYVICRKAWNFPLWFFITIILFSLIGSLFITDWPLLLFRELLRNPLYANFGLPGEIVNQWVGTTQPWIWNGLSLILLALLFYELLFFKNDKDSFLWKISLAFVLNPLIWMRTDLNSLVTLLLPFGLIFSQWINRDKQVGSIFTILFSTIFSFGLLCVGLLTQSILFIKPYPFFLYIFPLIILLLNLYWIRWWMVRNIPALY